MTSCLHGASLALWPLWRNWLRCVHWRGAIPLDATSCVAVAPYPQRELSPAI